MTIGARIEERRKALGIESQSELARRVPMRQSTLSGLIRKPYRWSPYLAKIARALSTTVEYLAGEIDDPEVGAPPPAPVQPKPIYLAVTLPSERALTRMFSGLLKGIDRDASLDELALLLAKRLPIGLSQLRDLRPELSTPGVARQEPEAALEARPMPDHEPTR